MQSTLLSTILSRMDRFQTISVLEEQYKVRDLDEAVRSLRREVCPPWSLKKSTLRVFDHVLEYPVASDHGDVAYIDNSKRKTFGNKARFLYTSLQQFYENPDDRNDMAEIWDEGTKYLGIRYLDYTSGSQIIDDASATADYIYADDITSIATDTVFYYTEDDEGQNDGNVSGSSLKMNITYSAGTATINCAPDAINDTNYLQKYFFARVYFDVVPTSVIMKFGNDSSNCLSKAVTAQFSGQAFKTGGWNLLAFDLNDCTTTGNITATAFDYFSIVFTLPVTYTTGVYYLGSTYLRRWSLMDYWYYSTYNVALTGATVPNQDFFYNSSEVFAADSSLVGEPEWIDVIMYEAMMTGLTDQKEGNEYSVISNRRDDAWQKFIMKYPDLVPLIITNRWRFQTDYNTEINSV